MSSNYTHEAATLGIRTSAVPPESSAELGLPLRVPLDAAQLLLAVGKLTVVPRDVRGSDKLMSRWRMTVLYLPFGAIVTMTFLLVASAKLRLVETLFSLLALCLDTRCSIQGLLSTRR